MRLPVAAIVALVALAAPMVGVGSAASDAEPLLLVRIDNDFQPLEATIEVTDADGRVELARDVTLALGPTAIEVPLAEGAYVVGLYLEEQNAFAQAVGDRGYVSQGASLVGCPGPTAADFSISARGAGTDGSGCTVLTRDAAALLAEARAAKVGALRPGFAIPPPGSGDRGVFGGSLFEWRGATTFLDAWGRPAEGVEARYLSNGGSMYQSADPVTGVEATAEVGDTVEIYRWRAGETAPHAWTETGGGFGTSETPTSSSVTIERATRYDPPWRTLPCALRHGLQGTTVRPGDVVPSEDVCAAWDGPAWRAMAPVTIEGHRLLPLYQVEESAEGTIVARIFLADGLPYPIAMERHLLPAGGHLSTAGGQLTRHEAAGAPIPLDGSPAAPPAARLAPVDALRGPATGEVGARLPFPLEHAADAALADPTLRTLAEVTARADAALLGAVYSIAQDDGSPFAVQRWLLAYASADAAPVLVLCDRPAAPLALPGAPAAPPRCRDTLVASGLVDPISSVPSMGRDAVPPTGASFADAIARWDAVRGEPAGEVTFAVYRAYREEHLAPLLAVGAGVPTPLTPADADVTGSADHVAVDLASGRTLAAVQVEQAGETIGDAPLAAVGPTTLRVEEAPFLEPESIPLVVAGGIGIVLLALLGLLLYSRLVRARVLDSATRAAILDVVAAEPGLHASGVRERLGRTGGVMDHHLDVLVREGFLTSLATPGFRRYFVTGKHTPGQMRAIAALREGQNEKLLRIIQANPGIPLQTLALEAGVSVPFASRSVQRLAEAGLVEKVQVGRALTLHAAES